MVPCETSPTIASAHPSAVYTPRLPMLIGGELAHNALCAPGLLHHRVREVAWHIPWYGFKTQARLARDAQVVPSTVSRLLRGKEQPSLLVALRLTQALSQRSGRTLDVREVFSLDGTYPTDSVCTLMGCRNCLPPSAFDAEDNLLEGFKGVEAGQWSLARAEKGGR